MKVVDIPGVGEVEFPDTMSDEQIAAAIRRDILKQEQPAQQPWQIGDPLIPGADRQRALAGRAIVEGVADLASPFANTVALGANKLIEGAEAVGLNEPGGFRFPEQSGAVSQALTQAGVPAPETGVERGVNFAGRLGTAFATGPRLDRAVTGGLQRTFPNRVPTPPPPSTPAQAQASLDTLSRQFDVPLTAGEATRNPILQRVDTYLERLPGIGIRGFRDKQQASVKAAAGRLVDDAGGSVDNVGESIRASLNRTYQANRGTASRLFDKVDEAAAGVERKVGVTNRQRAAQEILEAEANLAKSGAGDNAAIAAAKNALDAPELSFAEARKLRSRLLSDIRKAEKGELSGSVNSETVAALKQLEQALEADMNQWAQAAGGKVERIWRNANQYYRTSVVPFKDRAIRNAMGDDFDPDKIIRTFIRPDARGTAGKLVDRLDLKGKEAVRYGILRDAFDNSMDSSGFFSPQKFRNNIERLGKTRERVFTPQQESQLQGFARLAEAAKRAGQYTENPSTGARLMEFGVASGGGAAAVAGGLPAVLAGAGGIKVLSVLMTSQRGRAILTRASQYAPDSAQMQNALRAAAIEINRVINEQPEE